MDTRPAIWAKKATEQEKQRWREMQRTDRSEAATSEEEEWTYILDGAEAESDSIKNENAIPKDADGECLLDGAEAEDVSIGERLRMIEELEQQLRQEHIVRLLLKFAEDPNAKDMEKDIDTMKLRFCDIIQLLSTEQQGSTVNQEIVMKVLRKLEWKEEEIEMSIQSWKKEGRLQAALKNKSMIWVKTDDQWKEAKMKKYNPQDRSWDVRG